MEIRKALLDTLLAGAANAHAAMPVHPLPRPARRARAVSAAIGRCDRTPSTEVHSKRPCSCSHCLGRRDGDWWK